MTTSASHLHQELTGTLSGLNRRIRFLHLVSGLGRVVMAAVGIIALFLAVDWMWGISSPVRLGFLVVTSAIVGLLLVRRLLIPMLRHGSAAEVAALVEDAYPGLQERLSSAIELSDPGTPEQEKGSALMRGLLVQQTRRAMQNVSVGRAVDPQDSVRWGTAGAVAVAAIMTPMLFFGNSYGLLLARFFMPWQNLERASNLYFVVEDGDRTVARGSDVTIAAIPQWRLEQEERPATVRLSWTDAQGGDDERRMVWDEETGAFVATLPHVFQDFNFFVAADDAKTRTFHVQVVEAPAVTKLSLVIEPPAYTGLPAQTIDGAVGETMVFAGSRVRLTTQFNKPAAEAVFQWMPLTDAGVDAEIESQPLVVTESTTGTLDFTPATSGRFVVRLVDEYGLENDEPSRRIRLLSDEAPGVHFADANDHPQAKPTDVLRMPVHADDDIGIGALELHYELLGEPEKAGLLETPAAALGARVIDHRFELDLKPLNLPNGSVLAVRARAADERPSPEPNEAWSEIRLVLITENADPYGVQQVAERQQRLRAALQALRQDVEQNRDAVAALRQEAEDDHRQQLAFDGRDKIAPLATADRQHSARAEELASLMQLHPLYANLSEPLRTVADEPLAEAGEHLDAAEPAPLDESIAKLGDAQQRLSDAVDDLAKLERQFDELAKLENDLLELQRLADQADRLASDVSAFDQRASQTPANATPAERQALEDDRQMLQGEHAELTAELNDLMERRPEVIDAALLHELDRLDELTKAALELAEREDQLADSMRREAAMESPASEQQQLLDELRELDGAADAEAQPIDLDSLRRAVEALETGNLEAALAAQEAAARGLERLADELEKNAELPADPKEAARQLAERQDALADEMRAARESLPQEAFANPETSPELQELAAAEAALQMATAQLQTPPSAREARQEAAQAMAETLEQLRSGEDAEPSARASAKSLERLADEIGTPEERREAALAQLQQLRRRQDELSNAVTDADRTRDDRSAEENQQRFDELAQQQQGLTEEFANLDAMDAAAQQRAAQAQSQAAQGDLANQSPEAPQSQRNAQQSLADLERAMNGQPTAGERVSELQRQQSEIGTAAQSAADDNNREALQRQAEAQQNSADALAQLDTPAAPTERAAAQQAAESAGEALRQAAEEGGDTAAALDAVREAGERLDQLAQAVTPAPAQPQSAQPSPAQLAESAGELAQRQQSLADAAAEQMANPNAQSPSGEPQMSVAEANRAQSQLAREAASLALETAERTGPGSASTQQARQFAQQAAEAARESRSGQLQSASETASQAATAAQTASDQLATDEDGAPAQPDLSRRAGELAEQQAAVAEEFGRMAATPSSRRDAQQSGQSELSNATQALSADLASVAGNLAAEPISGETHAQRANRSQQSAQQATQSAAQSSQQLAEGNVGEAAQAAANAAAALREAAGVPPDRTGIQESPVPGEVGNQVAQAARELQRAGEQLASSQMPQGPPGETPTGESSSSGEPSQGEPMEGMSGESPSGDAQGMPSESSGESAAESLRQAASALQQAAGQLQPSMSSNAQQASGSAPPAGQASSESPSSASSESQEGGSGTQQRLSLAEFEAQLQELSTREWGELPGTLQTELRNTVRKRPDGDYARLIKLYFDEISRRQVPTDKSE